MKHGIRFLFLLAIICILTSAVAPKGGGGVGFRGGSVARGGGGSSTGGGTKGGGTSGSSGGTKGTSGTSGSSGGTSAGTGGRNGGGTNAVRPLPNGNLGRSANSGPLMSVNWAGLVVLYLAYVSFSIT
ncbi:hypothetical protein OROGR_003386 [Orobanche gracilis]